MSHILYSTGPFAFGMLDMTVKLFIVDEPSFILSDHPAVLRNQYSEVNPGGPGALGMLARGLQMFMSVSPTMTVAVYDGDVYKCGSDDSVIVKMSSGDMSDLERSLRDLIAGLVREEVRRALSEATQPDEFLTTARAAEVAKVAQGTIRRWIRDGRLAPHHAGRELRVRRSDLDALMHDHG
jgi:excisionase family DNA binding protein